MIHRLLLLFTLFVCGLSSLCPALLAEEQRPVAGCYGFQIGENRVLSTYLSPLRFHGTYFGVYGQWGKALPSNSERVIMNFRTSANFGNLYNPANTALMTGVDINASWGISWRKRFSNNLQFTAGGIGELEGGAFYLTRNSNNPVCALAALRVLGDLSLSYHFNIGRLPVLISDNCTLPLFGLFFSPQYGETYYEIYLGNRSNLLHPGWWGSDFRISNHLAFTLDFGKTAMELGYRFTFHNQYAENLTLRTLSHQFTIGIIPNGIGLKNRKKEHNYSLY